MAQTPAPNERPSLIAWLPVALFVAAVFAGAILLGRDQPLGFACLAAAFLLVLVHWHAARTTYLCPECQSQFKISTLRDLLSPHMLTTKYLRCPACDRLVWARAQSSNSGRGNA